jgi:hypothetical protein
MYLLSRPLICWRNWYWYLQWTKWSLDERSLDWELGKPCSKPSFANSFQRGLGIGSWSLWVSVSFSKIWKVLTRCSLRPFLDSGENRAMTATSVWAIHSNSQLLERVSHKVGIISVWAYGKTTKQPTFWYAWKKVDLPHQQPSNLKPPWK